MTSVLVKDETLRRCVLTDAEAARFRAEADHHVFVDPDTRAQVSIWARPDGHLLFDDLLLPKATP